MRTECRGWDEGRRGKRERLGGKYRVSRKSKVFKD